MRFTLPDCRPKMLRESDVFMIIIADAALTFSITAAASRKTSFAAELRGMVLKLASWRAGR
jgi:hypothetical protein